MAKRKVLTKNQREYVKAINNLRSRMRAAERRGIIFESGQYADIFEMPKRVTKSRISGIKKLNRQLWNITQQYVDINTGEIFQNYEAYRRAAKEEEIIEKADMVINAFRGQIEVLRTMAATQYTGEVRRIMQGNIEAISNVVEAAIISTNKVYASKALDKVRIDLHMDVYVRYDDVLIKVQTDVWIGKFLSYVAPEGGELGTALYELGQRRESLTDDSIDMHLTDEEIEDLPL